MDGVVGIYLLLLTIPCVLLVGGAALVIRFGIKDKVGCATLCIGLIGVIFLSSGITTYYNGPIYEQDIQILNDGYLAPPFYGGVTTTDGERYLTSIEDYITFESEVKYKVRVREIPSGHIFLDLVLVGGTRSIEYIIEEYPPETRQISIKSLTYQGADEEFYKIITEENQTCFIRSDVDLPLISLTVGSSYLIEGYESETGDFYITSMTTTGGI